MKGTVQRLWRGASAILESVLARLRHVIIEEYGPSSIIIDGGGRIVFLSLGEEAFDFEKTVLCSLLIDKKTQTRPIYNLQISTVVESIKRDDEKLKATFEREVGEEFAKKHLPPFLVKGQGVEIERNAIFKAVNEDCMICGTLELDKKRTDWDSVMKDPSSICTFHRLLYLIGMATRMNDASIRKRGKPWVVPSLEEDGRKNIEPSRKVVGISKLDLNSLGIIFSSKFDESDEWSIDIRRRRSFRFNSYWWQIVQKSIDDEELEIDAIAAWIAAGDDITIAEYANKEFDPKNSIGLRRCLESLNSNINEMFATELGGPLSFCAGYSLKQNGKSLLEMMDEATKAEKLAKRIWKTKIQKTKPELLFNQKTKEKKKFCSTDLQGEEDLKGGYSMILEYDKSHDDEDDCQNSNPEQCKLNSNCKTQQTKKK